MPRREFGAEGPAGRLVGWVDGDGPDVLLLHGGPGLPADYLDALIAELIPAYRVAVYQQRGLAPSVEVPGSVADHLADVTAVLDALGWEKAFVAGHSWGGYLALHVAATLAPRLHGVLSIDPVGGIGDGGVGAFEAAMYARTPAADRERARELDERALRGEATEAENLESLRLLWPAYFADPARAAPMTIDRMSVAAYAAGYASMVNELPALESQLSAISVPTGFVAGAGSPIPPNQASEATAARIPNAWVEIVPNAGHIIWLEAPGAVRKALDRLVSSVLVADR